MRQVVFYSAAVLLAAAVCVTASGPVLIDECHEAFIPTDLDLITIVEQTEYRETHLHGEYRIGSDDFVADLGGMVRNLTLKYDAPTQFRMSVSPVDADYLALRLIRIADDGTETVVSHSRHGGERIERMVFGLLDSNVKYHVMIVYSLGLNSQIKCPKVLVEMAAQPVDQMTHFFDSCSSAQDPIIIPSITPTSDNKWYYEWTSNPLFVYLGGDTASVTAPPSAGPPPRHNYGDEHFSVVGYYPVTVPFIPGHHSKFKLRALIHANFIDGGDVGYVLTMGNSTSVVPSPRGCARHHHGLQCYYGARAIRNTVVLQEQLTADIYNRTDAQFVLWIIRRRAQHNINRVCAPVQLKIQLHPLPEQETFINCEVDPLPPSFNAPGLYNNVTGVLRFTGDVLVNLTTREQKALLQTSKKRSLLRAWVANHDEIDVDIMLYDMSNKRMLAASMAMTGPEGLVYELVPNVTYGIALAVLSGYRRYSPRDHDFVEFCDSFQLQVHVFPISSSVSDDAGSGCGERGPDLGGVPQQLNTTGTVNFGLTDTATPPFSFPIDTATVAGQKAINGKAGFRFYLKKASFFFALMNADTYGGTPQMVLTRDRSADTLYSTPRTVGSSIYGQLEPGWYNLKFVTPYVQSTSKTWSEISSAIPTCIRYNFKLRISPTRGCLQPLLIPAELPNTPHGHHHLFDEYRIPDSGTASVSLPSTGVTSTLHVQVQESDAPATIVLYSGDISDGSQTEIARSHRIVPSNAMDSIQLFTNLDAQTSYTLTFTFDLQAGIPTSCRTMQMQLALNPMPDAPTKKCPTPQGTIDLGAIAPPFDSNDARMIRAASRPLDRRPIVFTFNLTTTSHFRFIMDFDFNIHATGVQLCPCPEPTQCGDLCTVGYMYFNGVEIPRQTLSPGVYSVAIFPTTASMTTGRDLEHDCSLLGVRFVLAPIAARKPPSMCPRRMQYLPSSLNTVGILSRYYNREAHFLQLVRVNEQHYIDESTFVLTDRSILRVSIPGNGYTASVRVLSADRQRSFGSGAMHTTVVALDPGQYILVVTFSVRWNNFRGDECLAVPLELGIIKAQDVPKLAEAPPGGDVDSCESPYPLPTTMTNHGHRTMYRKVDPTNQFHHTINFTVGSSGAYVEADLRYNFQVAGLGIRLQRADASNPKAVTFGYYADRSYFGKDLPPGDYQLEVYDPVWAYPTNMPFVNCTPWSLHLRQWDAAAPLPSVSLVPGGPVVPATSRPTHRPMLDCPYYSYNTLPRTLDRSTDASSRWFSVRGRHYEIPFANGVETRNVMFPSRPLHITYTRTSLVAFPGDVVRVWASSSAAVNLGLRLYQDNGTKPVDQALEFGHRVASLAYRPVIFGTSAHMSVEVSFVYTQTPEYPRDYTTCWNKEALTSFELYLAVFPRSRISDAASCDFASSQTPSPVTAAPAHTQLAPADYTGSYPPASVTLDKPLRIEARTYYFSRSDCKKQRPSAWSNSPAPHTLTTISAFPTTCSYIMNVTVPPASMGVFFSAELKYSMLLSDMRSTLYYKNGSVVKTSRGGPAADGDERYNAETDVHAWGLAPGDYMYVIEQSFASLKTVSQLAEVCVPFELDLNLGGSVLGSVTEAPSMQGARVIQVMPNSIGHVDPAQPFRITMNVDQPLDVDFRPRGVYPIALLDKVSGTIVKPSGRYFASRTSVVTTYNAGTLKWLWPYDVVIDTTAFRTKDGQLPYNIAVGTLPSHRTSSCSCDQGVCSEGGACACHEAGQNCQRCPSEMRLTPSRVQLGPAGTIWPTKAARVCQYHDDQGDVPPATPSTATPQTSQPQPVPVSPDATPSPPDVPVRPTPPTDAPVVDGSGVVVTDTPSPDSKRPPFKFMRVVMSASALMLMAIFAGFRLVNWGHRRRHAQNFHNPFRRVAQNEDAADDQDDDPADPGTSTLPPASRPAATIVPDTRRKARHAVNADDDFSENDAIVH